MKRNSKRCSGCKETGLMLDPETELCHKCEVEAAERDGREFVAFERQGEWLANSLSKPETFEGDEDNCTGSHL